MSFTHNGPGSQNGPSKRVTHIAVDPHTRVLVLEGRARELRELKWSGDLTDLQRSLFNTELDLLRIAIEHCNALVELERLSSAQIENAQDGESLDSVLVA